MVESKHVLCLDILLNRVESKPVLCLDILLNNVECELIIKDEIEDSGNYKSYIKTIDL